MIHADATRGGHGDFVAYISRLVEYALLVAPRESMEAVASTPVSEIKGNVGIGRPRRYNHEFKLAEELRRRKVGFFLPMQKEERFWGGRKRLVWRRVFPGMIFIGNGQEGRDAADENHRLSGYEHVHILYQPKLKSELATIEQRLADQDLYPALVVGAKVCVTDGPFIHKEGIVESRDKSMRFTVRLDLLGDSTPVEIDAAALEPI